MDIQEAFNKIWDRAKFQKRAEDENFSCRYRTQDGEACFIGCLIPDELYDPDFDKEGGGIEILVLLRDNEQISKLFDGIPKPFLKEVQRIHDLHAPFLWKEELRRIAKVFNLEVPDEQTEARRG